MNPEEKKSSISESFPDPSSGLSLPNKISESDLQQNGELAIPKLKKEKLTIPESQEITRAGLANFLVMLLSGTIISSFVLVIVLLIISISVDEKKTSSFDKTSALVKDLITLIFTTQIGLVGTALGFYFGSKSNAD
jgi:hypothetical protein